MHAVVAEQEAGKCPICGARWAKSPSGRLEVPRLGQGADRTRQRCKRRHRRRSACRSRWRTATTTRSTAASSSWPPTAGTTSRAIYPSPGVFRLYLFDDYTKPLAADRSRPRSRRGWSQGRDQTRRPSRPRSDRDAADAAPRRPVSRGGDRVGAAARQPDPAGQLHRGGQGPALRLHLHRHSVASAPTTIDGATRLAMDIPNDADGVLAMLRRAARPGEGDRRPRQPHRGVGAGAAGQGPGA